MTPSPGERATANARYIEMADDMLRMAERLRSRADRSLELRSEVLPDEFHVTVPPLNLSRALRHLFDAPR